MVEQLKKFTNPDSLVSLFLGLAVVIVIGVLIVNYVKGRQSPQSQAQTTGAQNEQGATGSTGVLPATHTVAAGESLWSIATDTIGSGYNWIDIAKANNLTNPDVITEGQQLTIPSVAKREPGQISAASVTVHRPADGKYTVQKGDSLWSISLAVYGSGYRWSEIATLNKLANPGLIYNGNVLLLP
jgi:nucleoid-associated protein YgaU